MTIATRAAADVGRQFGVNATDPTLVQETNNTVVWLRPHPIIAKVATRAETKDDLRLEHAVAAELAALGADVAAPLQGSVPTVHDPTGFVVTLWCRIGRRRMRGSARPAGPFTAAPPGALVRTTTHLPSFRTALARAREALDDEAFMAALGPDDLRLLRVTYDEQLAVLDQVTFEDRRLHGEPHDGNRLMTTSGLRWIDFESCCVGPVEWDLAFQPPDVIDCFPELDIDLLTVLRTLNSARGATWCWGRARFPEMRRHGEMHLAVLRQGTSNR